MFLKAKLKLRRTIQATGVKGCLLMVITETLEQPQKLDFEGYFLQNNTKKYEYFCYT